MHLIVTAWLVSLGLIARAGALLHNQKGSETVSGDANEGVGNLRHLFDSILKDDSRQKDTYRNILQEETGREQRAFDDMKETLRSAQLKKSQQQEIHRIIDRMTAYKREIANADDLFHAIQRNDLNTVKRLIEEKGEKVSKTTTDKRSGAIVAAQSGHLPILKYFLEKNATLLTETDVFGNTVMQHAIQRGDLEMVKYLAEEKGINIHRNDHHISTVVHVAAQFGQLDVLKYFVEEKKADVNVRNLNGETPLFLAAEKPYMYIIIYLLEERNADATTLDVTKDNILYRSAAINDLTVPNYLMETRKIQFDVNWKNTLGYTVVNWASRFNSTEFVKYMVEHKKADIHDPDERMVRTPLHQAALTNNVALCEFLVGHGAKVDAKDKLGNTPANLTTSADVLKCLSTASNRARRSVAETWSGGNAERPLAWSADSVEVVCDFGMWC